MNNEKKRGNVNCGEREQELYLQERLIPISDMAIIDAMYRLAREGSLFSKFILLVKDDQINRVSYKISPAPNGTLRFWCRSCDLVFLSKYEGLKYPQCDECGSRVWVQETR